MSAQTEITKQATVFAQLHSKLAQTDCTDAWSVPAWSI